MPSKKTPTAKTTGKDPGTGVHPADPGSSIKDQIRINPSVELWESELKSVFEGRRNHDLGYVGEIAEHISVLIDGAKDNDEAERTFRVALSQLIIEWDPQKSRPSVRLQGILSLIAHFTPPLGFVKLAGYLREGNSFSGSYQASFGGPVDFQTQALRALGKYYPAPPPTGLEDPAYRSYVDILWSQLGNAAQFSYAAEKLLAAHQLSYSSPELLAGILKQPDSLTFLISPLFKPVNARIIEQTLSHLYQFCNNKGLQSNFEKALGEFGTIAKRPLMDVTYPDGRENSLRYPSIFLVVNRRRCIQIALSEEDIIRDYAPEPSVSITKLRNLLQHLRRAKGDEVPHLEAGIVQELSAIMEHSARSSDPKHSEVESALQEVGGVLRLDEDENYYEFYDGEILIPVKSDISPLAALVALGEVPQTRKEWEEFAKNQVRH